MGGYCIRCHLTCYRVHTPQGPPQSTHPHPPTHPPTHTPTHPPTPISMFDIGNMLKWKWTFAENPFKLACSACLHLGTFVMYNGMGPHPGAVMVPRWNNARALKVLSVLFIAIFNHFVFCTCMKKCWGIDGIHSPLSNTHLFRPSCPDIGTTEGLLWIYTCTQLICQEKYSAHTQVKVVEIA